MTVSGTKDNSERAGLRLSVRLKMLFVFAAVLLLALGTHLYLATSLFTEDKLAYIYDMNASLVASLAEQTRVSFSILAKEVLLFARAGMQANVDAIKQRELAQELFTNEADIVRVELYERSGGALFERRQKYVNPAALNLLGLAPSDLEDLRRSRPLPFAAIAGTPDLFFVQNASLPPDAAMLTLAFAIENGSRVAVVDFRHERLLRVFGRSHLQQTFLVDEHGEVLAHPEPTMVISRANLVSHPLVQEAFASPVEQGVIEFETLDEGARLGAYAQVGMGRMMVLTQVGREEALQASRELARRSILFAIAILSAAFIATLLLSRRITAPIRRLSAAAESIGQGRFVMDRSGYANDEIGDLATAFERMTVQLKGTQSQLIQSERMAAFGALGAGITHEVKNPITSLVGFAQLAQKKIEDPKKVLELLKIIETESLRCRDILSNFLKFARGGSGVWERLDVTRLVQEASRVLKHQLVIHKVQLELQLGEGVPEVTGNSGELQQVLVNLAMNAQQAMLEGGTVWISTERGADGGAVIAVRDNGPGIPEAIRDRIFEPFFTTKPPGQGTGLGLAISFSIVRNHKGTLTVQSEVGQGATFFIKLPPAAVGSDSDVPAPPAAQDPGPPPEAAGAKAAGA